MSEKKAKTPSMLAPHVPTHAMLLAAGLGARMRPLTDTCPKPLLEVAGTTLIECHLNKLAKLGITQVVINVSYLAEKIQRHLGNGERYGVNIQYSFEPEPLETAGGICKALPMLGEHKFLLLNADVWLEFDFFEWFSTVKNASQAVQLVLVDNPEFHPEGDFYLMENTLVQSELSMTEKNLAKSFQRLTYGGVGIYAVDLFRELSVEVLKLAPLLRQWMTENKVGGIHHQGLWSDVGTPERLRVLRNLLEDDGNVGRVNN